MKANSFLIFIGVIVSILAVGLIVLTAIDRGVWFFLALLGGIVMVAGVAAWLTSFVVKVRERLGEMTVKQAELNNNFELNMARQGLILAGGRFVPRGLAELPAAPQPAPLLDPRHDLLVSLCLLTIRTDSYGPTAERLLTADDAQARGGKFADRNNWDAASKYGQELGLCYTKVGGAPKDQGLKINGRGAGGCTAADLLDALMERNRVRDSAVNALPGVNR